MSSQTNPDAVSVRLIDSDGALTEPTLTPKVIRSDEEWRERLTPEQYRVARNQGTEPAFCGGLLDNKISGIYVCVGCDLPLFSSDAKFESGTGWPSFFQPVAPENVLERTDSSHGMARTEVLCPRCESHLGHVFGDGPAPTGMRHCLNSESLRFVPTDQLAALGEGSSGAESAEVILAGGCFWCVEAVFLEIDGVVEVVSGYSGGDAAGANYEAVCSGRTGHAEAVKIVYDPRRVTYERLLEVHFATHDPTTLNRQGGDAGTQYRSAIFYKDEREKKAAQAFIAGLDEAGTFSNPIVTTLEPLEIFYAAEAQHQNYVCRNPHSPYVQAVAMPKVEKVRAKFEEAKSGGAV